MTPTRTGSLNKHVMCADYYRHQEIRNCNGNDRSHATVTTVVYQSIQCRYRIETFNGILTYWTYIHDGDDRIYSACMVLNV